TAQTSKTSVIADRRSGNQVQGVDIDISGDVEVQFSIIIVIAERAARVPVYAAAQTSRFPDLRERAVAIVPEQKIDTYVGDEDIHIALIVEIGCVRSAAPVGVNRACPGGDVFEA